MTGTDALRQQIDEALTRRAYAIERVREERKTLETAQKAVITAQTSQELVQRIAQQIQQQAHQKIASVVTHCLRAVFGEDAYEFRIEFDRKRGRTEARLVFVREGVELDPVTAAGGGVVDVAALALRLSCLMLAQPKLRRLLILDEPLKHLSSNHIESARAMLERLVQRFGVQIIMVTHNRELACGKIVEL